MPELPEVEMVRRGLENHPRGREIETVVALHPHPVRSHPAGPGGFVLDLTGRSVDAVARRGKYFRLVLGDDVIIARLGMSEQFWMNRPQDPQLHNTRVLFDLNDGAQLHFVDQHMFDGLEFARGGSGYPVPCIALDPFDPNFDPAAVVYRMQARRITVKHATLDQGLVPGIGNIYVDESL